MQQFVYTQLPIRFGNGPLAMHPFGFDAVQPGTLAWQGAHHDATAAFLLDAPVVRLEPRTHGLADVPRGIVPHHQEGRFPFRSQQRFNAVQVKYRFKGPTSQCSRGGGPL